MARFLVDVNREGFERMRNASDLFAITVGDWNGPILTRTAEVHRRQEAKIFSTEGAAGESGPWPPLSPAYAERKRRAVGRKKILVWSGDMKDRFLTPGRPEYVERYTQEGTVALLEFGAQSEIAGYHAEGADETRRSRPGRRTLTPAGLRRFRAALASGKALTPAQAARLRARAAPVSAFVPKTFRWHLPQRDMVSKTREQEIEILRVVVEWYRKERVPQALRAVQAAGGGSR